MTFCSRGLALARQSPSRAARPQQNSPGLSTFCLRLPCETYLPHFRDRQQISLRRGNHNFSSGCGFDSISPRRAFQSLSAWRGLPPLSLSAASMPTTSEASGAPSEKEQYPIVVTGVTRGLGRALALELANRGYTIVGCGRDKSNLETLQKELPGEGHFLTPLDVADDVSVKAFADETVAKMGVPRIVVNCAGLINKNKKLWDIDAAEFNNLMAVNVNGTANVIRHFVPLLLECKRGVIVNFSSGWGRSTAAEVAPYCASKWAIEGLTKALAKELPEGVVAVALNPGVVDTDMLRSCFGSSASLYGTPSDWAPLCADIILALGPKDNGASLTV